MLGPLVNPAQPQNQLVGVYDLKVMRLYQYIHQDLKKNYTIVHALDGYDEVSLTGPFKTISNTKEEIVTPEDIGLPELKKEEITGGESIEEAAAIFMNVLGNTATGPQTKVVVANSALAIRCIDPVLSMEECIGKASLSIENGQALNSFKHCYQSVNYEYSRRNSSL